jgi:hypothetical protein
MSFAVILDVRVSGLRPELDWEPVAITNWQPAERKY